MKVSIIMPAYNSSKYIGRGIESVINQTYRNLELLIIDDGSTDNTEDVVNEFQKKDGRILFFKKDNNGVSSARNLGLKKSTGDYIIFLDSDDWLEENAIENLIIEQTKHRMAFVCCDCFFVDNNENGIFKKEFQNSNIESELLSKEQAIIKSNNVNYRLSSSCYKLFQSNIIKKNNLFFDETIYYAEDGLFTLSYLLKCEQVFYTNQPLWNILNRSESASNSGYNKKMITMSQAYEKMIQLCDFSIEAKKYYIFNQISKTLYIMSLCFLSDYCERDDILFYRKILRKYKKEWNLFHKLNRTKTCVLSSFPIFIIKFIYKIKRWFNV